MRVLATYNIKGGVGKTATAVNLAYLAAQEGSRVLIWDLDPQGASSFYFRIKAKVKGGVSRLLKKKALLDPFIKGTDYDNLDLLPADFSYRRFDTFLGQFSKPHSQIRKRLKPLANDYDLVFIDCPPGLSETSESVFHAADALLIPTLPTTLSLRTLDQIIGFLHRNPIAQLQLIPFFSMVDRRKQLHRQLSSAPPIAATLFAQTAIPYASDVEKMGIHRAVVHDFAPNSVSAQAYRALWSEIKTRLEL